MTTVEWFIDFVMTCNGLLARGHKGITLPGNDVAVAPCATAAVTQATLSKKAERIHNRFVESKNGLSLSQIVTLFLSVFVGCR